MTDSTIKRSNRGRTLLVALAVGSIGAAALAVTRPVNVSAASVGISYVTNFNNNSVTEYATGATGNAAPIRTIVGAGTGLSGPVGAALDATGTLYIANSSPTASPSTQPGRPGMLRRLAPSSGPAPGSMVPTGWR